MTESQLTGWMATNFRLRSTRDALAAAGRRSRSLFDVSAVQPGLLERRAAYRSDSGWLSATAHS